MMDERTARLRRLFLLLQAEGFATVAHLSRRLLVSEPTMRRDLADLESQCLIVRVRGGAVIKGAGESPVAKRLPLYAAAKQAIAAEVAPWVRPGQCIALDIGTTMMYLAAALSASKTQDPTVRFVTNGMRTARILSRAGCDVVTTGGRVRSDEDSLVGPIARRTIRSYGFDAFFLSLAFLSPRGGLDVNLDEIEVKKEFILHSRSVYALVDSSKIGPTGAGLQVAELKSLTAVVTDTGMTKAAYAFLRNAGVRVVIARSAGDGVDPAASQGAIGPLPASGDGPGTPRPATTP